MVDELCAGFVGNLGYAHAGIGAVVLNVRVDSFNTVVYLTGSL